MPIMRSLLFSCLLLSTITAASAVTGNAPPAAGLAARSIVMVIDADEDLCSGTALARDVVLTAAHCVARPAEYQVKTYQDGKSIKVRTIVRHPRFDMRAYMVGRATIDLALLKLAAPLPDIIAPASLAPRRRVQPGESLTIAGFGVTVAGTARGLGIPRMARLAVTGRPGSLQIRLVDPEAANLKTGLGACTGDSGAPAFDGDRPLLIGVVSWSTGPNDTEGCGGLTGLTPLLDHGGWVADTTKKLESGGVP